MNDFVTFLITLGGLVLIVLSNNIMGTLNSVIDGSFDKNIAKKGIVKAAGILLGLVIAYTAGLLVPNISIGMINGQEMTIQQAVSALITGAYGIYAFKFVQKCAEMLQVKTNINNIANEGETSEIATMQRGN